MNTYVKKIHPIESALKTLGQVLLKMYGFQIHPIESVPIILALKMKEQQSKEHSGMQEHANRFALERLY